MVGMNDCCSLGSGALTPADAAHHAATFKILAEPSRLQLLSALAAQGCQPQTVGALARLTELSQPTVSYHLKKLTDAGLINRTVVGREVFHTIVPEPFAQLRTVLQMD